MKENMSKKIVSGLFWKFGERIFAQGVSFVVSIVLARLLNPDEYGIIAIVLIFINLADVFITSGFSTALIQNKDATEIDFSTNFYCGFAVSIFLYIILFFAAPYIAIFYEMPSLTIVIRVFALKIPFSVYNSIQHAYVSRNMLFKRFFFSTIIGTIISGIVGILMAYEGFGVWALVMQYFTNSVIDTLVLSITVPWHLRLEFDWRSAKKMMGFGSKVFLVDFTGSLFSQLRSLIVGRVYTASDLAFYNKGQQIPELVSNNISTTVMSVLFPAIANRSEDIESVKRMSQKAIRTISYIVFPCMAILCCIAKPLFILLYTDKWAASIPYVQIFCFSSALSLISTVSLQSIKGIGKGDVLVKLELVKKPMYVVLLLIGVRINVFAVAITMAIYNLYGTIINMTQLIKYVNYNITEQIRDLLSATFMSMLIIFIIYPLSLFVKANILLIFLQCFIAIIIYILISYILKIDSFIYIKNIAMEYIHDIKKYKVRH